MRTLYLLRHAKSTWKDNSQVDFERPLARRGRRACMLLAAFIQANEIKFDLIFSSTAVRARETIELIRQQAKLTNELRFDERLYDASAQRIIEVVSELADGPKSVMVVGHNPGLEHVVNFISVEQQQFPTAALAKIKVKGSKWPDLDLKFATLEWVVRPKELEQH